MVYDIVLSSILFQIPYRLDRLSEWRAVLTLFVKEVIIQVVNN